MNTKKTLLSIIIMGIILAVILFSGCTEDSIEGIGTDTIETSIPITVSATDTSSEKSFEPVKLPGPGSAKEKDAVIPEYDPEMEEKFLSEAKAEILRVFPEADTSSFNNYYWDANRAGSFFVPVIIFENVIVDIDDPNNFCRRIYYDPKKERIVHWDYSLDSPSRDVSNGETIYHEDVDIETDIIPVFKKMIGDEEYVKNKDNYFIYLVNSENSPFTTIAYIRETSNGVKSYMGKAEIHFNRANGEIFAYGEGFNDKEFFEKSVTLSPVPEISLDEAKSILESKIDEYFSDIPQNIEYTDEEERSNCLFWMDEGSYLNIEDGYLLSPVPLAWLITYKTEETRNNGDRVTWAVVDASSGDILYLRNSRIDIKAW